MQEEGVKELYDNIKANMDNYEKYRRNKIVKRLLSTALIFFILFLIVALPLINRNNMYISYITAGIACVGLIGFAITKLLQGIKTLRNVTKKVGLNVQDITDSIKDLEEDKIDKFAESMKPLNEEIKNHKKQMEKKIDPFIDEYRDKVLCPIIESVFSECEYKPYEGLEHDIYASGFEDKINEYVTSVSYRGFYESENRINAKLDNKLDIVVAEIFSSNYNAGEERGRPLLSGMAGYIKLPKNYNISIKLKKHVKYLLGEKRIVLPSVLSFDANASLIETVQQDYFKANIDILDKLYDIEVDDKEKAAEILNNDFFVKLSKIVKQYDMKFRFSIVQDILYLWFDVENKIFKPRTNHKLLKKDIEKLYNSFSNVKNISEELSDLFLDN